MITVEFVANILSMARQGKYDVTQFFSWNKDRRPHVTNQPLPIQVTKNVYVPLARKGEVIA